jgi:methylenetetrahydrofolate dehydrogenase (NADP+)/methenyltetrahydrofolate cyclohydrolase
MNNLIDGKVLSQEILKQLKDDILLNQLHPKLAIIKVGNDPASSVYVKNKLLAAEKIGVEAKLIQLEENITQQQLEIEILNLNKSNTNGYIVQLPLPQQINENKIINLIDPAKDIDGFGVNIAGAIMQNNATIFPCTPLGIIEMIQKYSIDVSGKNVVVLGRSNIVGKPIGMMLLNLNATVTFAHSKTNKLDEVLLRADIIVSAVGKINLVNASNVKRNVIIFDVGINRNENNQLCGDVNFKEVQPLAKYITPVPGGVGPMTVAMLMKNLVNATKKQK